MTAPVDEAVVEPAGPVSDGEFPINLPVVVIENLDTSDGRFLTAGGLTHRALPLSLLAQPESMHGGNDAGPAGVVGRIDTLTRTPGPEVISKRTGEPFPEGTFIWSGTGHMLADAKVGDYNIAELFRKGYLRGVSVDLAGMDYEVLGDEGPVDPEHPRRQLIAHSAEIAAATILSIPAFGDAYAEMADGTGAMAPTDDVALAASAAPAWRSAEVGDYSPARLALVAAADEGMPVRIPADSVEQLIQVIDSGEERDAPALATAIVEHIAQNWAATEPIGEDELPEVGDMSAQLADEPGTVPDGELEAEGDPAEPQACIYGSEAATRSLVYAGGEQFVSVCDEHEQQARDELEKAGEEVSEVVEIGGGDAEAAMADDPMPAEPEVGMPDAPQDCPGGTEPHPATKSLMYDEGRQFAPTCDEHEADARAEIEAMGFTVEQEVPIVADATDKIEVAA